MESKHKDFFSSAYCLFPFNRTSMESKLPYLQYESKAAPLLIEPVWNRNMTPFRPTAHMG